MTEAKKDLREQITDRIVASLESGVMPWRKGWTNEGGVAAGLPRNAVSGRIYSGGNRLMLMMQGMDKGYADPRWLTYKQAASLGGGVTQGEKSTPIEYWDELPFHRRRDVDITLNGARVKLGETPEKNAHSVKLASGLEVDTRKLVVEAGGTKYSWKQAERTLNLLFEKTSHAFNVEQCTGLSIEPITIRKDRPAIEKIAAVEKIADGMKLDGLRLGHGGDRAYYSPARDAVQMPNPEQFETPEAYAGTLLHELGHATGGENRLNRPFSNGFGTSEYAREELVAELCSAFASAETGVQFDDKNHAAYIGSWLEALKGDKHAVFAAAKDASKAVDYLLEKSLAVEVEQTVDCLEPVKVKPEKVVQAETELEI
ncbi:MAG TPA: zincin-like metallopeptidase domain-containing protein [Rhodoferax sp.]|nr:zincin-like metallopeptidase domain-containing protein [Rhodoferax sp.]HPW29798.1 zincin-like metallopeptidase domain-containing protein [Rhodoferax sp.]